MAPTHKFCTRCNRKHAAPTGKCKCRLPIPVDDFLDDNTFEALVLTGDDEGAMGGPLPFEEALESTPEPPAAEADVQADTLTGGYYTEVRGLLRKLRRLVTRRWCLLLTLACLG
jgi:hypothetical protein